MTRPYRQRSDETWAAARVAFEGGEGVAAICERFDLADRTLRQRQKDEGWRGRDLDVPLPAEPDPESDDLPPMGADDFADLAYHRMTVAARQGRVSVALAWSRLRDATLRQVSLAEREADRREAAAVRHRRTANNESMDDVIRTARGIEAQAKAVLAAARIADLDDDELPELQTSPSFREPSRESRPEPARPPTRAERRRRAALARKRPP